MVEHGKLGMENSEQEKFRKNRNGKFRAGKTQENLVWKNECMGNVDSEGLVTARRG